MRLPWYSKVEFLFKILLGALLLSLGAFLFFRIDIYLTERKISLQQDVLDAQNKQLDAYMQLTGYQKLAMLRDLEEKTYTMPWFQHIPKVISILENVKSVDGSDSENIILSDFKVSLDEISVKWKVSNLKLLYYTSPNGSYTSLFDRFQSLDFIKDIKINTYAKAGDYFEFVLTAKVINDDTSK